MSDEQPELRGDDRVLPSNLIDAQQWKVEQFFRKCAAFPFLAAVIGQDGQVLLFEKSVTQDDLRKIASALENLIGDA